MPLLRALCRGLLSLSLGAYFGAVTMSAIAAMTVFQVLDPGRDPRDARVANLVETES